MSIIYDDLTKWSFATIFLSMLFYWTSIAFPTLKLFWQIAKFNVIVSNLILFVSISGRWLEIKHFPLSNLYESLMFLTWCMTFTTVILDHKIKSSLIGGLISPLATFTMAFATLVLPNNMQKATALVPALKSNWLVMHVSVMMISYAVLMVGTLLSILYLVLNQYQMFQVNNQTPKVKNMVPISASYAENKIQLLENIDNLSYRTIGLGFPLLTLGIISGAVWANEAWGSYWSWDPKETWALVTWLVFASYLHVRINRSWSSKQSAILASIGFIVVWICYLGVNFLGQGLHSYGWLQ